jgi:hypothetical protein
VSAATSRRRIEVLLDGRRGERASDPVIDSFDFKRFKRPLAIIIRDGDATRFRDLEQTESYPSIWPNLIQ